MEITIKGEYGRPDITIKIGTEYGSEMYRKGGMICRVAPWSSSGCPITLSICICPDGAILKRAWDWVTTSGTNPYLHAISKQEDVEVTDAMRDTVGGLFSGRILVDGVKIAVGASVQEICPIDLEKEEQVVGKKIFVT